MIMIDKAEREARGGAIKFLPRRKMAPKVSKKQISEEEKSEDSVSPRKVPLKKTKAIKKTSSMV